MTIKQNLTLSMTIVLGVMTIAHSARAVTRVPAQAVAMSAADRLKNEAEEVGVKKFMSANYKRGTVKHVVLFRYTDQTTPEQKAEIARRFVALKQLALRNGKPYIVSIETGSQSSGEGVDQNLEQGFIVTFKSAGDRNYYVGAPIVDTSTDEAKRMNAGLFDPAHQEFKEFVGDFLHQPINPTGVVVFDFAVENKK